MKNKCKAILALLFAVGLLLSFPHGVAGASTAEQVGVQATGDDGATNWDFIDPVTHLTTVPEGFTAVTTAQQLDNIRNNLSGKYILMNDIDLSGWGNWVPIGNTSTPFTGTFDGNGYAISNLNINVSGDAGLFGKIQIRSEREYIKNLCIIGGTVKSGIRAGAITGTIDSTIYETVPKINNCITDVTVEVVSGSAVACAGGAFGLLSGAVRVAKLVNKGAVSCSTSNQGGYALAGGLLGRTESNTFYAEKSGNFGNIRVTAASYSNAYAGGLIGSAYASMVYDCFNQGEVLSTAPLWTYSYVGGILGYAEHYTSYIRRSYSSAKASFSSTDSAISYAGGLVGYSSSSYGGVTLGNSYYSAVSDKHVGNITNNNGNHTSVSSLSDAAMRQQASFVGFDFDTVWQMPSGGGYPVLRGMQAVEPPMNIPVTGVTLDPKNLTLDIPSGAVLYATVVPANATNKAVVWTSSNEDVATVNDGAITAKNTGNATIIVTTVDGGFQASCDVTVDIYNIGEETYRFANFGDSDSKDGHCFGMSATSSAYYLKLLDITITGGNNNYDLYALDPTVAVKAPICHYQARQGSAALKATVAGGNWYKTYNGFTGKGISDITSDWTAVVNYVKSHAYDGKGSLQIGYRGVMHDGRSGGHAINFLRYSEGEGQSRIYVYDNNFPDSETYFYKDASGFIRQAPSSTFPESINCIAIRDVSTYFSVVGGFDEAHIIYADEGEIFVEDASAYPMEGTVGYREHLMIEIPAHLDKVTIIPLIDNATFKYLDKTYSFGKIDDETFGVFTLSTSSGNPSLTIMQGQNPPMPDTKAPIITGPSTVDYKGTITLTADKPVNFTTESKYVTLEKVNDTTVKVTSTKNFIKTGSAQIKATPIGGGDAATVTVKVKPTFVQWIMIVLLFGWIWM